jgi:hypothetical protein
MTTQLLIKQQGAASFTPVSLFDDVPFSITYSVADIRNPESRNGSYSKTLNIPGTKETNKLFEFIFNVNSALQTFNPNLKCEAIVVQDGTEILHGNMRLARIYYGNEVISYDIEIYGQTKSLFDNIGNKLLNTVNLSAFNHLGTQANQVTSWSAPVGSGYVYNLNNNGTDNLIAPTPLVNSVNQLPSIYVKSIVDAIMTDAGYTYTSNFFNTTFFKSLIVPCFKPQPDRKVNFSLAVDISGCQLQTGGGGYQNAGQYNQIATINIRKTNPVSGVSTVIASHTFYGNGYVGTITANSISVNQGDVILCEYFALNNVKFTINSATWNVTYPDGSGTFSAFITSSQVLTVGIYGSLTMNFTSKTDPNGVFNLTTDKHTSPLINLQNFLPDKILQRDFMIGLIRMFNLYMDIDRTASNNILIEPRDDYYAAGGIIDWTSKWATDQGVTITPMNELDTKQYIFQYTPVKDFFNNLYTSGDKIGMQTFTGWNEPYGQHIEYVANDFITKINTIQPVFSPTIVAAIGTTNIVVPTVITKEPGSNAPNSFDDSGVIRILYYGGLKNCSAWKLSDTGSGTVAYTSYPYAGHLDDVQTPTCDLLFDIPKQVYYTMASPTAYTNNNLFNRFWKKAITEITDKDSKMVSAFFYLTPQDIGSIDFRSSVKVNEQYYHINRIIDYKPNENGLTQVELTKMNEAVAFTASTDRVFAASPGVMIHTATNSNISGAGTKPQILLGGNNIYNSTNAQILLG